MKYSLQARLCLKYEIFEGEKAEEMKKEKEEKLIKRAGCLIMAVALAVGGVPIPLNSHVKAEETNISDSNPSETPSEQQKSDNGSGTKSNITDEIPIGDEKATFSVKVGKDTNFTDATTYSGTQIPNPIYINGSGAASISLANSSDSSKSYQISTEENGTYSDHIDFTIASTVKEIFVKTEVKKQEKAEPSSEDTKDDESKAAKEQASFETEDDEEEPTEVQKEEPKEEPKEEITEEKSVTAETANSEAPDAEIKTLSIDNNVETNTENKNTAGNKTEPETTYQTTKIEFYSPLEIKVDNSAPEITITENTSETVPIIWGFSLNVINVKFTCTDNESGIKTITVSDGSNNYDFNADDYASPNGTNLKLTNNSDNSFSLSGFTASGDYTIKATDKAYNTTLDEKIKKVTVQKDSVAPEISSVKKNKDTEDWGSDTNTYYCAENSIDIDVTADDKAGDGEKLSGIEKVFCTVNGDKVYQLNLAADSANEYKGTIDHLPENQQSTIKIYAKDKVGNPTDNQPQRTYNVYCDTNKPNIDISNEDRTVSNVKTFYISDNDSFRSKTVKGKISDDGAGIRNIKVIKEGQSESEVASWNKNNAKGNTLNYDASTQDFSMDIHEDGLYKIIAEDDVNHTDADKTTGNTNELSFNVVKDTTPPTIDEIKYSNGNNFIDWVGKKIFGKSTITIQAKITDDNSMLEKDDVKIFFDNQELKLADENVTYKKNIYTATVELQSSDSNESLAHELRIQASDNVGNVRKTEEPISSYVDKEAPKLSVSFSDNVVPEDDAEPANPIKQYYFLKDEKNPDAKVSVTATDDGALDSLKAGTNSPDHDNVINRTTEASDMATRKIEEAGKDIAFSDTDKTLSFAVEAKDKFDDDADAHVTTDTYRIKKISGHAKVTDISINDVSIDAGEDKYVYRSNADATIKFKATFITDDGEKVKNGIKKVEYSLVGTDGGRTNGELTPNNNTDEYSVPISSDFKGRIDITITDRFNRTEPVKSSSYFIIEKSGKHSEVGKIDLTLPGANGNSADGIALYKDNTTVHVVLADSFSGIKKASYTIKAPYDTSKNAAAECALTSTSSDKDISTGATCDIPVSNNSNNIKVTVTLEDNAGNTSSKDITFGIDKTAPKISVSYDNNENIDGYYKADRTATVTINERNFVKENVKLDVKDEKGNIPSISDWTDSVNAADPDSSAHTCTVHFSKDGDYTFEISLTDAVGNSAEDKEQPFTLDKTAPVVVLSMDGGAARNTNFYNTDKTATIKVTEHNFDPSKVTVSGQAADQAGAISFPGISSWNDNGDTHTATLSFNSDGVYKFTVDMSDKAGNVSSTVTEDEFHIDKTMPEITITGVANESANAGDVAPQITFKDENYDRNSANVTLVGANNGVVDYPGSFTESNQGQTYTFENFKTTEKVDDVYTLTATATDMAGNEFSDSVVFSVNRFGSVYTIEEPTKDNIGKYVKTPFDVVVKETNVDALSQDKTKVSVMKNDVPETLDGGQYSIDSAGGGATWHQYTYTLGKNLFANDGTYAVSFYSVDAAGNVNENINETKKADIKFGVDGTAPIISADNIKDKDFINSVSYDAEFTVRDNLVLDHVKMYVDDQEAKYSDNGDDTYTVKLPESTKGQKISVVATDAAGNQDTVEVKEIIVSTNAFLRFFYNKPLFYSVTGGAAGLIALIIFSMIRKATVGYVFINPANKVKK